MEGDLAKSVERLLPRIGHIQLADVPGRHEPGSGEINFDSCCAISTRSATQLVGCEVNPQGDTLEGLKWAQPLPVRNSLARPPERAILHEEEDAPGLRSGQASPPIGSASWRCPRPKSRCGAILGFLFPEDSSGAPRRRYRPFRRRAAGGRRRAALDGEVKCACCASIRCRWRWCSPACATPWCRRRRRRFCRPLLRARPVDQIACTIGGNVCDISGVHCLKYGLSVHNVLGLRGFTIEGEPFQLGGEAPTRPATISSRSRWARTACCAWSPK